jgi:uncharacterized protein YodC (DUF2158 family)
MNPMINNLERKAMSFKQGEVGVLKSGCPEMTIKKIIGTDTNKVETVAYKQGGSDGDLVCQWFAGNKLESGIFLPSSVEFAED